MNTTKHTTTEINIESLVATLITSEHLDTYLDQYAHFYEDFTDINERNAALAINFHRLFDNHQETGVLAFFNLRYQGTILTINDLTADTPSFIDDTNRTANRISWILVEHSHEGQTRSEYLAEQASIDEPALNFYYRFYQDLGDDGTDELNGDLDEISIILQIYLNAHPDVIPNYTED